MLGFGVHRVVGVSMRPGLTENDYVVYRSVCNRYRAGDVVIVEHPRYATMVKRVARVSESGAVELRGDGPDSLSTEQMGWVPKSCIKGKVVWQIKSPPEGPDARGEQREPLSHTDQGERRIVEKRCSSSHENSLTR